MALNNMEKLCQCGDTEDQHVDGDGKCFVVGCGCPEFEQVTENEY